MAIEPIEIHEPSPAWAHEFKTIGAHLRELLGTVAQRIDHIGSTSVTGLAAKPIIDIQISVQALEPADVFAKKLEAAGYVWRRDNPELTKRYFREAEGSRRTHIHVRRAGSWHEQFPLLFRDYIRLHPEDQRRYRAVKRDLAARFRLERQRYTDAKDPIFWEIMYRADRWAATTGWQPGPSDA